MASANPFETWEKFGAHGASLKVRDWKLAEREGFEPSVPLRVQRFSRPPRSTTPAPLLGRGGNLIEVFAKRKLIDHNYETKFEPGHLPPGPKCFTAPIYQLTVARA